MLSCQTFTFYMQKVDSTVAVHYLLHAKGVGITFYMQKVFAVLSTLYLLKEEGWRRQTTSCQPFTFYMQQVKGRWHQTAACCALN